MEQEKDYELVKSVSAYVLVKTEKDSAVDIFYILHEKDIVYSCTAVRGNFNIIMLVQGENFSDLRKSVVEMFKEITGVKWFFLEVVRYNINGKGDFSSSKASFYALLDLEKGKEESVMEALKKDGMVVSCELTKDDYGELRAMLLMQGPTFYAIKSHINTNIARLDGVLRPDDYPILYWHEN
jgi:hypothetical protein